MSETSAGTASTNMSANDRYTLYGNMPVGDVAIYSGTHAGALFNMINMRCINHADSPAVLFLTNSFQRRHAEGIIKQSLFDAVVIYDGTIGFTTSDFKTESEIFGFFDAMLKDICLSLESVISAYLFSDVHDQFGAYLLENGVMVYPVETAIGAFGWKWRYEAFHKEGRITDDLYELQKRTTVLCGENIKSRILMNSDRVYSEDSFDNVHAVERMSKETCARIVAAIGSNVDYADKTVVVLNSWGFLKRKGLECENCRYFSSVLRRYFALPDKEFIIKLHPYSYSPQCFGARGVTVVGGGDLIDIVVYTDSKIAKLVDIDSTSFEKIKSHSKIAVRIGQDIYRQYAYYPIADYIQNKCESAGVRFVQNCISDKSWVHSNICREINPQGVYRVVFGTPEDDNDSVISVDGKWFDRQYKETITLRVRYSEGDESSQTLSLSTNDLVIRNLFACESLVSFDDVILSSQEGGGLD